MNIEELVIKARGFKSVITGETSSIVYSFDPSSLAKFVELVLDQGKKQ